MGNSFRRALSLILLMALGIIIYRFATQMGTQPGVAATLLRQMVWFGGAIALFLWLAWRFRARR